jgi:hypothetical protein
MIIDGPRRREQQAEIAGGLPAHVAQLAWSANQIRAERSGLCVRIAVVGVPCCMSKTAPPAMILIMVAAIIFSYFSFGPSTRVRATLNARLSPNLGQLLNGLLWLYFRRDWTRTRWHLQHSRVLASCQFGQQHNLTIGQFKSIVVCPGLSLLTWQNRATLCGSRL